ncbi:FAD binding domain-containing protein [Nocardioides cheoyonin]|uniref:FAD binding domain-containing protein n=1 Tax=Nocardioides cheoyonin TaxID=3156615 RepID=UPI0032B51A90
MTFTIDPTEAAQSGRIRWTDSVDEAVAVLASDNDARPVGGGVWLALRRREGAPIGTLVPLDHLPGLTGVREEGDELVIGAASRLADLESDPLLRTHWPALADAVGAVGTARIRRLVTIGGNLAAADETHDPPVALAAAGAVMTVRTQDGTRKVPTTNRLAPGELIIDLRLPRSRALVGSAYEKFLVRGLWEYPCVHVAAVVELDSAGDLMRVDLAVGSVREAPYLVDLSDLTGHEPNRELIEVAAERSRQLTPRTDAKGSADYKQQMIAHFTRRALQSAISRARHIPARPGGTA